MNPETNIIGYCRECGKALDEASARHLNGTIFCQDHAPKGEADAQSHVSGGQEPASPWTASASGGNGRPPQPPPLPGTPRPQGGSPALAFALGWIPGVGAIYNGQYVKGFIHVVIFGLLVSLISSDATGGLEPLFGLMLTGFIFYMAFEAMHTAKQKIRGEQVDEFANFFRESGRPPRFIVGPVVMIIFGVLFLLNNLGVLEFRLIMRRYWPVLLIVMGIYTLIMRVRGVNRERQ